MKYAKFPAKMYVPPSLRYTILTVLGQLPPNPKTNSLFQVIYNS